MQVMVATISHDCYRELMFTSNLNLHVLVSMLPQTLHVRVASDTQTCQSLDWKK